MKIETCDWSHPCGDGGCYSYGTTLYLDGKEVKGRTFFGQGNALKYVLEEILGHTVENLPLQYED